MKTQWINLLLALSVSAPCWAAPEIAQKLVFDVSKATSSDVEFLAIGNPSALKIRGKAEEVDSKKPIQGNLVLQNDSVTGKVTCTLDNFDTGISMRNHHMKEKYLETQKFPESVFNLTELKLPAQAKAAEFQVKNVPFKGELTLHGVTKPIEGTATVSRSGAKMGYGFEFKLKSSEFGIQTPAFMGITMADEITVDVALEGNAAAEGPAT
jgi:polyisoprenoid-binding protein YceI